MFYFASFRFLDIDSGKIVDAFYRLLPVSRENADTISNAILAALEEDGLDKNFLVGVGVDGAAVNVGNNHSVSTNLRQIVKHLIIIRCVCHSLAKVNHFFLFMKSFLRESIL